MLTNFRTGGLVRLMGRRGYSRGKFLTLSRRFPPEAYQLQLMQQLRREHVMRIVRTAFLYTGRLVSNSNEHPMQLVNYGPL